MSINILVNDFLKGQENSQNIKNCCTIKGKGQPIIKSSFGISKQTFNELGKLYLIQLILFNMIMFILYF